MKTIIFSVSGFCITGGNFKKIQACFSEIEKQLNLLIKDKKPKIRIHFKIESAFWPSSSSMEINSSSENADFSGLVFDEKIQAVIVSNLQRDLKDQLIEFKIEKIYFRVGANFQHVNSLELNSFEIIKEKEKIV